MLDVYKEVRSEAKAEEELASAKYVEEHAYERKRPPRPLNREE
jgi:hypothetical protein